MKKYLFTFLLTLLCLNIFAIDYSTLNYKSITITTDANGNTNTFIFNDLYSALYNKKIYYMYITTKQNNTNCKIQLYDNIKNEYIFTDYFNSKNWTEIIFTYTIKLNSLKIIITNGGNGQEYCIFILYK